MLIRLSPLRHFYWIHSTVLVTLQYKPTKINQLLKNKQYALDMAVIWAAYYEGQHKLFPYFFHPRKIQPSIRKALKKKLAINLAGFYALECGKLPAISKQTPSDIFKSIINDSIAERQTIIRTFLPQPVKPVSPFVVLTESPQHIHALDLLPKEEVKKIGIK
jgi:hypothetical protein